MFNEKVKPTPSIKVKANEYVKFKDVKAKVINVYENSIAVEYFNESNKIERAVLGKKEIVKISDKANNYTADKIVEFKKFQF